MDEKTTDTKPLVFPDVLTGMSESLLSVVMIAVLLEPEEVKAVADGKLSQDKLLALLPDRLPGGDSFSSLRLVRALGIRNLPEELEGFYKVFTGSDDSGDTTRSKKPEKDH